MKERMKTGLLLSILVSVSLAGMLVLAVNRISDLENQLADTREERAIRKSEAGAAGPVVSGGQALPAVRGGNGRAKSERPGAEARSADLAAGLTEGGDSQSPDEVVGQLIRALMQTDAGRKMALEESVENAEERFAPLLEDFAFSDEERAHFLELAGAELGSEDMLWMELLMAKDEDRERIMQTWETDRERRLREMKAFLNDEEDWDRYRRYQARVPEYEQMDGLRTVMMDEGVPMTAEQEAQLVDLLYRARVESGMRERWEGRGVLEQLSEPGMVQRLRDDWKSGVSSMGDAPRQILSGRQAEIFEVVQAEMMETVTEELSEGLRFLRPEPGPEPAAREGGEE